LHQIFLQHADEGLPSVVDMFSGALFLLLLQEMGLLLHIALFLLMLLILFLRKIPVDFKM
jgi:hypothetical protein